MSPERNFPPKDGRRIGGTPEPDPSAVPPPDSAIRVRKLRPDGSERLAWTGAVLRADRSGVIVRAEFALPRLELGYTTFQTGDVFVEFYLWHRWYTVA